MTKIGSSIDGKYDVIDLLGEGGMSRVWLARDKRLNKLWAVKEIGRTKRDANNEVVIQSLIAEAGMMKEFDHPAFPRIVDIIENEQTIYVVMDYIEGDSLRKTMKRLGHPMAAEDVIDWGIQLCDALEYLHTRNPKVIYRDMKPSNIMLRDDGTVKLIDFGTARTYKEGRTSDTKILGTQGYAPPELYTRNGQSDERTDIYSLGVTLYHLVTGRSPIEDPVIHPIREINPQLPEGLEHIIKRATEQDPEKRYASCAEMRYDLEHYEKLTQEYRSVQEAKLKRFNSLWIAAVVCVAVGVICLVLSSFFRSSNYGSLMEQAESADTTEMNGEASAAEANYLAAIDVNPATLDSYEDSPCKKLIDLYKSDGNFSMTEASRWISMFNEHRGDIDGSENYAKLCYDVGTLYFVYYENGGDSGESADVRTYVLHAGAQAAQWYQYAAEDYERRQETGQACSLTAREYATASAYITIGEFYQKLSQATLEGEEGSVYEGYWEALENAVAQIAESDAANEQGEQNENVSASVMVKLTLYEVVYEALGSPTYLNGFRRAGVEYTQAEDLFERVSYLFSYGTDDLGIELDTSGDLYRDSYQRSEQMYNEAQPNGRARELYAKLQSDTPSVQENINTVYANAAMLLTAAQAKEPDELLVEANDASEETSSDSSSSSSAGAVATSSRASRVEGGES